MWGQGSGAEWPSPSGRFAEREAKAGKVTSVGEGAFQFCFEVQKGLDVVDVPRKERSRRSWGARGTVTVRRLRGDGTVGSKGTYPGKKLRFH